MTPIAITFLILAIVVVWGGLVVSVLFLRGTSSSPASTGSGTSRR